MHVGMCLYYRIYSVHWEGPLELTYLCSSLRTRLISYSDQAAHKDRAVIYRGYSLDQIFMLNSNYSEWAKKLWLPDISDWLQLFPHNEF